MTSEKNPDDLLAAEYALRLLSKDELEEANRRAAQDPEFAQAVTHWEIRLAALTDDLLPQQPDAAAKASLMARLFPQQKRPSFWQRAWVWQALSILSLIALAFVALNEFTRPTDLRGPLYTAEIVAEAGDFRFIAVVDKANNEVILTRTAGAVPDDRILQVWAHGEGAPALSVGLWPDGDTTRLPMPPTIAAVEGILTLGVSEEPPGGSLTGSPSGRVYGTVDIPGVTNAL